MATREVADAVRQPIAFSEGWETTSEALPLAGSGCSLEEARWLRPGVSLRQVEKRLLELTLHATAGNRTHAAELLGVSLRTVRNKIREYGLPRRRQS